MFHHGGTENTEKTCRSLLFSMNQRSGQQTECRPKTTVDSRASPFFSVTSASPWCVFMKNAGWRPQSLGAMDVYQRKHLFPESSYATVPCARHPDPCCLVHFRSRPCPGTGQSPRARSGAARALAATVRQGRRREAQPGGTA